MNGLYVYQGILSATSLIGKGKKINYPNRPFIYDLEEQKIYKSLPSEDKDKYFRDTLNEWI